MISQIKRNASAFGILPSFKRFEETLLGDVAEQIDDALLVVAPRTGFFRYCNRKALELTGYTREDLDRISLSEMFNAPEAAGPLATIRSLERGLTPSFQDVPLKTKSGRILYVDLKTATTEARDKDKDELVILFVRDSEQRLMLQRATGHQHQSFGAISDITNLVGKYLNQPAAANEDPIDHLLAACQQYTLADFVAIYQRVENPPGYQLQQAINPPSELPTLIAGVDPVASGEPFTWRTNERTVSLLAKTARNAKFAVIHTHPVGKMPAPPAILVVGYRTIIYQNIDTAGLVQTVANLVAASQYVRTYVSQHEVAQQSANDLERRFELLINETTEGIVRISSDGHILDMNRTAEGLLGFSIKDTRNAALEDVLISPQPLALPIITSLQNGMRWGGTESDLLRRDGETVPVFVRAIPLIYGDRDEGGLIFLTDRTDLRQFQTQSDHLERRAWLGDLSAIFAHDVRNPLNGIAMGLTYLGDKFEKENTLLDSVSKMQAEVQRIDQLLKNVLLVAKSNEINYQPVALHQTLDRVLGRWGRSLGRRKVQLVSDIDPRTPLAIADAHQMDQVLTNLIVNAVDAMEEKGGTLGVKCHAATHPKTPQHGEYVQITIADTGPGIPPELQARVFDPFFTTKATGTGLGLAITKRIITAHKGSILLDGSPGIGTIFVLFIPVARPHPSA